MGFNYFGNLSYKMELGKVVKSTNPEIGKTYHAKLKTQNKKY